MHVFGLLFAVVYFRAWYSGWVVDAVHGWRLVDVDFNAPCVGGLIMNAAVSDSLAARYANKAMAAANNLLSAEKARVLYLACAELEKIARCAEHDAFMSMSSVENNHASDGDEFHNFMRENLKRINEQLKFISGVINEKA